VKRTVLNGPPAPKHTRRTRTVQGALGGLLTGPYALLGWLGGCPGVGFRWSCLRMALRGVVGLPLSRFLALLAAPLDSVRYFEFDFVRRCLDGVEAADYLDVSSPRLLPLALMRRRRGLKGVLLNPDRSDLQQTEHMVRALGLSRRCRTLDHRIEQSGLVDGSFDLITSVSVVEHIPAETDALASMWRLLQPGGRLILTVPCAASPAEEWADFDRFGLGRPGPDGLYFWQRFYSPEDLESRLFTAVGRPVRLEIYGEKRPGCYDRAVLAKMRDPYYPVWREPWMMAREWKRFDHVRDLPGVGVAGMMFLKE
jgi:SAM-dependent methyltransferase